LDENLDLATLAAVAPFSAFHFHRLFHALTGEPLSDYIRRRLVEMAAMRLRSQPDVPVLEIALAVGFGSTEAFARAFRARFQCTPTAWRNSKHDQLARKSGQAPRFDRRKTSGPSTQETVMKVKIVDRQ